MMPYDQKNTELTMPRSTSLMLKCWAKDLTASADEMLVRSRNAISTPIASRISSVQRATGTGSAASGVAGILVSGELIVAMHSLLASFAACRF